MALGDHVLNEVALLADLPAGGFKIKNLAAGAVAGDSARYDELNALDGLVIKKDGSVAFTGDQAMGGFKLTGLGAPGVANDALRYGVAEIRNEEIAVGAAIAFAKLEGVPALDSVVIKKDGTVAFTGDQDMAGFKLTNLGEATLPDADVTIGSFPDNARSRYLKLTASEMVQSDGADIFLCGGTKAIVAAYGQGPGYLSLRSKGAQRLTLKDGAECDAFWEACIHKGLKLGEALDANSQKVTNLLAPTAEGDAVSLGDAVLSGSEAKVVANVNTTGGLPVVFRIDIADAAGDTDVIVDHKIRVIDAWAVKTEAVGGAGDEVTVKNAAAPITDAIDIGTPAKDNVLVRAGEIDDASHEIDASGTLRVTAAKVTNCACIVYVLAIVKVSKSSLAGPLVSTL